MLYALILFPLLLAAVSYLTPSNRYRPLLLPIGAFVHLGLAVVAIIPAADLPFSLSPLLPVSTTELEGWLTLDALGKVFLGYLSVLFFLCSLYAPGYLALRKDRDNRVLCANLFASLAMMTLVTVTYHLGILWVAM